MVFRTAIKRVNAVCLNKKTPDEVAFCSFFYTFAAVCNLVH